MKSFLLSFGFTVLITGALGVGSATSGDGTTTRGWSCCKNSCSWSNKAAVNSPVISCDNIDNLLNSPARRDGCESGGGSYACSDLSPWAASNDLAYGYAGVNIAASNESAWCCSCYQLTFTSGPVYGKKMVVQVVNTGTDLGNNQFDLAIPGGGQGDLQGCTKEFGGSADLWGASYGGVAHREDCNALPEPLKGGCYWRFDWFRNADNPTVSWEKVVCPDALSYVSGCRRNDDPVGGKVTPTPTKSAPIESGTVSQGGQCGGKTYKGPTVCVGGTVCTYVDENHYYCLPDPGSTRTTPTTTSQTPVATIGQLWDQCGGTGWPGPFRCKDSTCVYFSEYWSQCQPESASGQQPVVTTKAQTSTRANPPWGGQWTRPHRTWPGQVSNPAKPSTTKNPNPPAATGQYAQLYDQCGGKTWAGSTQCAPGLKCVYQDEWYSQCQKPV
ncbi:RlpA-like double-psi beta-barrel-protein domain-containing protein-containing protein [Clohesyomyces aquaticus]|uniref:cellulase n=1 Tax=Clohesyomyces aquaticus TaxID=1231657 RepID=A0A1Y1YL46_9PLEO|nr:RlpA-like double-psi beta-barrel-protein domain-containing protein-containing protein [Clohesyomyces aquaticus]